MGAWLKVVDVDCSDSGGPHQPDTVLEDKNWRGAAPDGLIAALVESLQALLARLVLRLLRRRGGWWL